MGRSILSRLPVSAKEQKVLQGRAFAAKNNSIDRIAEITDFFTNVVCSKIGLDIDKFVSI